MLVVSCSAFVFFVSWLGNHRHFDKDNILLVHQITINSLEQNSVMYEPLCFSYK